MDFFIDHENKRIHQKHFAGDRCGFLATPIEKREFTTSADCVDQLIKLSYYSKCPHCQSAQSITSRKTGLYPVT